MHSVPRHGGVTRRAFWGVADQALSSLTNFALGVFVARNVSPDAFGAFGLAFALYMVVLNCASGVVSEPFILRYSLVPVQEWRRVTASACGAAICLGLIASAIFLVGGVVGNSVTGPPFLAFAPVLPGLVLAEIWRALLFARGAGAMSFFVDLTWALLLLPILAALDHSDNMTVVSLTLAWGSAGTGAAIVGSVIARAVPRVTEAFGWVRRHRDLIPHFVGELLVLSGGQQATIYGIAVVGGLSTVAGIRGAQMLLGPLYVLIFGIRIMAVPEAMRFLEVSVRRLREAVVLLGIILVVITVTVGTVLSLLPARSGEALLGNTWTVAQPALFPIALVMAAAGASISARVGLRALAAGRRSLSARLCSVPLIVIGGVLGAVLSGARSAAFGMAAGAWLGVINWWWQLFLALKERELSERPAAT